VTRLASEVPFLKPQRRPGVAVGGFAFLLV
jgi:hypothetical protein